MMLLMRVDYFDKKLTEKYDLSYHILVLLKRSINSQFSEWVEL